MHDCVFYRQDGDRTVSKCVSYSRKILQGLKFAIFAIQLNLQTFHFAKCFPLNRTMLILNKTKNLTAKSFTLNKIIDKMSRGSGN